MVEGVLYICDKKKACNVSPGCGRECNCTTDPAHAANFVKIDGVYVEKPRAQQVTAEWIQIGGTEDFLCSYCNSRLKPYTFHGKKYDICPICSSFMMK
ncbi:MAG: hypothetical protein IKU36_06315 [Bacteroidales bacterium]|nr:hypothetical protein [Bacteroidales bacterium]